MADYPVLSTDKVLKMSYVMNGGKTMTHSLKNPKDDLTKTVVAGVMNEAIQDDMWLYNDNEAIDLKDAYIVETNKYELL